MKKILLAISSLFLLVGCSTYTVDVKDVKDEVKINGEVVEKESCKEYSDSLFGLFGDYPLEIQIGESDPEEKPAGNYAITADGKIEDSDEACEVNPEEPENEEEPATEEEGEGDGNAEEEAAATEEEAATEEAAAATEEKRINLQNE